MEKREIERVIPHRTPFLLVDKIVELDPGRRAVGLLKVCGGDCLLAECGGLKAMPGVLVLEALAQVGAVAVLSLPEYSGSITLLAGIDNAFMYGDVSSGEEICLEAEIVKLRKKFGIRRCRATVGERIVAEADLLFVVLESFGNGVK